MIAIYVTVGTQLHVVPHLFVVAPVRAPLIVGTLLRFTLRSFVVLIERCYRCYVTLITISYGAPLIRLRCRCSHTTHVVLPLRTALLPSPRLRYLRYVTVIHSLLRDVVVVDCWRWFTFTHVATVPVMILQLTFTTTLLRALYVCVTFTTLLDTCVPHVVYVGWFAFTVWFVPVYVYVTIWTLRDLHLLFVVWLLRCCSRSTIVLRCTFARCWRLFTLPEFRYVGYVCYVARLRLKALLHTRVWFVDYVTLPRFVTFTLFRYVARLRYAYGSVTRLPLRYRYVDCCCSLRCVVDLLLFAPFIWFLLPVTLRFVTVFRCYVTLRVGCCYPVVVYRYVTFWFCWFWFVAFAHGCLPFVVRLFVVRWLRYVAVTLYVWFDTFTLLIYVVVRLITLITLRWITLAVGYVYYTFVTFTTLLPVTFPFILRFTHGCDLPRTLLRCTARLRLPRCCWFYYCCVVTLRLFPLHGYLYYVCSHVTLHVYRYVIYVYVTFPIWILRLQPATLPFPVLLLLLFVYVTALRWRFDLRYVWLPNPIGSGWHGFCRLVRLPHWLLRYGFRYVWLRSPGLRLLHYGYTRSFTPLRLYVRSRRLIPTFAVTALHTPFVPRLRLRIRSHTFVLRSRFVGYWFGSGWLPHHTFTLPVGYVSFTFVPVWFVGVYVYVEVDFTVYLHLITLSFRLVCVTTFSCSHTFTLLHTLFYAPLHVTVCRYGLILPRVHHAAPRSRWPHDFVHTFGWFSVGLLRLHTRVLRFAVTFRLVDLRLRWFTFTFTLVVAARSVYVYVYVDLRYVRLPRSLILFTFYVGFVCYVTLLRYGYVLRILHFTYAFYGYTFGTVTVTRSARYTHVACCLYVCCYDLFVTFGGVLRVVTPFYRLFVDYVDALHSRCCCCYDSRYVDCNTILPLRYVTLLRYVNRYGDLLRCCCCCLVGIWLMRCYRWLLIPPWFVDLRLRVRLTHPTAFYRPLPTDSLHTLHGVVRLRCCRLRY